MNQRSCVHRIWPGGVNLKKVKRRKALVGKFAGYSHCININSNILKISLNNRRTEFSYKIKRGVCKPPPYATP